jgi:thymidylate kinase
MKNHETDFEKRAQSLLKHLDSDGLRKRTLPRPFIIEVTGSPDSGKTTTLKILDSFFRRQGYTVWKPLEGAEAVRRISRKTHLYNVATGMYAMDILINHLASGEYDLILFDRCLYDAWCWQLYWLKKQDISIKEAQLIQNFFAREHWRKHIDIAFFIMCNPEVAMGRDQQWSLTKKSGTFTNINTVQELFNIFKTGYNYFKTRKAPVALIDTTRLNPQQVANQVLNYALNSFERRFAKENKS